MSTLTKVFIVLTAILSIAVSCLFIAAAAQMANWRELAEQYQQAQLAEVTTRMNLQTVMESRLAMAEDTLRQSREAADAAQRRSDDLNTELLESRRRLAAETNDRVAAQAGQKKLQEILDVQNAELTALRQQNGTLLTQNMDLQTRNTRLNSRVLELTSQNTILTEETRNLQEKLYAAQATQRQAPAGPAPQRAAAAPSASPMPSAVSVRGPIRGEITNVEGSYASINIGESSGVTAGMTFMVHRGATFVAELVIDRVQPQEAGGKLRTVQQAVQVGDAVAYGLEGAGG